MTEQSIILPSASPTGYGGHPREQSPLEFLIRLHRLFRGRYVLAIVLATLGGTAGGLGGYFLTKPKFQTQGSIRIHTQTPKKVFETELSRQIYNPFDLARTQANLIRSPRVIEQAMKSAEWRGLGRPINEVERDRFADALRVSTSREEPDWVRVQFADENRDAARIAVEQVLAAYKDIYSSTEIFLDPKLVEDLTAKKKAKSQEIMQKLQDITRIKRELGAIDPKRLAQDVTERVNKLDEAIFSLEARVAQAERVLAGRAQDQSVDAGSPDPNDLVATAQRIARDDASVARALDARTTASRVLEAAKIRFGPRHRGFIQAQSDLAAAEAVLADAVRDYRARALPDGLSAGDGLDQPIRTPSELDRAKQTLDQIRKERDVLKDQLFAINEKMQEIARIETDIKGTEEIIAQFDRRINEINTESRPDDAPMSGRIQVFDRVENRANPVIDKRFQFAVMGLAAGAGIPLAFVLLLGLMDRRVRYSDDAGDPRHHLTLLGILPYLPNDLQDPEQASIAAHCVHQIRTLLQIGGQDHSRKVFAVTSPTSGDGKTSLAMSLGLSFAASGARTLLIDFDMIGGGLTSAIGMKEQHGLLDAVLSGELNGFVRPTSFNRLTMMPVGKDDARDVSRLSLDLVRNLIRQAKERYDAVVIDTGPILGSLEASLVCAAADGAILTLGRGQQRGQAEKAMEHLSSIGATFLGVVFNRAEPNDFRRAVSSASVRSRPLSEEERLARPSSGLLLPQMGPVARTVASHLRAESGKNQDGTNANS